MDKITDVCVGECANSRFVQPYRVHFKQNGKEKIWDCTKVHDSVAVLIFNTTRKAFVFVKQFRPAVFMSKHKPLWENSAIFLNSLSQKPSNPPPDTKPPSQSQEPTGYGHGSMGCTYELCAGIVDKSVPLQQITKEEILEETGYDVPLGSIELINTYYSSVGHSGSRQHLYYCEVSDAMMVSDGGGNETEGEMIEVVHMPAEEGLKMIFNAEVAKSTGVCFAILWFEHYKKNKFN